MNRHARRALDRAQRRVARGRRVSGRDSSVIRTVAAAMGVASRKAYLAKHPNPPEGWVLDTSDDLYAPATGGELRVAITLEDGEEFEEAYRAFVRDVGVPEEHVGPQYRVSVSRFDREPDSSDLRDVALAEFGYAPAIVGARSMVVSHACGWTGPFSTWLDGEMFYAEPMPGIRVPTRGCPKCRSSITAASLVCQTVPPSTSQP